MAKPSRTSITAGSALKDWCPEMGTWRSWQFGEVLSGAEQESADNSAIPAVIVLTKLSVQQQQGNFINILLY